MDNSQLNFTDTEKLAEDVQKWTDKAEAAVKAEGVRLGIQHVKRSPNPSDSLKAVKGKVRFDRNGMPTRIGFKMRRNLVFVHKGVGKETPIEKVGQTRRRAKPWFNPIIEQMLPELADTTARNCASIYAKRIFIR